MNPCVIDFLQAGLHEVIVFDFHLSVLAGAPSLIIADGGGLFSTLCEVFNCDFGGVAFIFALDDRERRASFIGIFQLRAHIASAHIGFGAQTGLAELGGHIEIIAHAIFFHDEHDDRAVPFG